jgi:hypothetical protein
MRSMENFMAELPVELAQAVDQKLLRGIALITDYSGSGQPEHALKRLCRYAEAKGIPARHECLWSSDISEHCRDVLTTMSADEVGTVTEQEWWGLDLLFEPHTVFVICNAAEGTCV